MRRRGEAETVRACAEAGGVRTGRQPAAASEGEAKEDHLNIVGMQKSTSQGLQHCWDGRRGSWLV